MHTVINGKTFNVKQTGNRFFYWSPRAIRWLPVAAARVVLDDPDYEKRVKEMEAQGLTRSDAQGVIDAQDMQRNPKPWVVVRHPGEDDEDIINDFSNVIEARKCIKAHPGSDLMKRLNTGQLTTEY